MREFCHEQTQKDKKTSDAQKTTINFEKFFGKRLIKGITTEI